MTRRADTLGWVLLLGMTVAAVVILHDAFVPPRFDIDTEYRTGTHLVVVFAAPFSEPEDSLINAVRGAVEAARRVALEHGFFFSTVGISNEWAVGEGLKKLDRFGPFDELIVGRNWLNTGVDVFMRREGSRVSVPQVIMFLQGVETGPPAVLGDLREIHRSAGREIQAWAVAGYPLACDLANPACADMLPRRQTSDGP